MMSLKFTKMHGLGNDFVVIDAITQKVALDSKTIRFLSDRHTGIGFDQCLLVEASDNPAIDFNYRIYNADGTAVGQCGNGARCLARFIQYYGLSNKKTLRVATTTTTMNLTLNEDETVTITLATPEWSPDKIPLLVEKEQAAYAISIAHTTLSFHAVNVGNPHAVLKVGDVAQANVKQMGPLISLHPLFPEHVNAGFMEIIDENHLKLRVYERGVGETQACGSGAVAAAAVGRRFYSMSESITVSLAGGNLRVDWPKKNGTINLTGPAVFVYEGQILL